VFHGAKVVHFQIEAVGGGAASAAAEFRLEDSTFTSSSIDGLIETLIQILIEPLTVKLAKPEEGDEAVGSSGGDDDGDGAGGAAAVVRRRSSTGTSVNGGDGDDGGTGAGAASVVGGANAGAGGAAAVTPGGRPFSVTEESFLSGLESLPQWKRDVMVQKRNARCLRFTLDSAINPKACYVHLGPKIERTVLGFRKESCACRGCISDLTPANQQL
jgi:hypothetical protein